MMNFKGIMKQKTLGAKGAPAMPSFMNAAPAAPPTTGGLLKKKKVVAEVKPVPSLMKRLTGK